MAGGSPPAEIDISVNPDMLPTATSVTTEVSEGCDGDRYSGYLWSPEWK